MLGGLEILMLVATVVFFARLASMQDKSPVLWGVAAFAVCFAAMMVIPLPGVRILIAFAAMFVGWMVYLVVADRP